MNKELTFTRGLKGNRIIGNPKIVNSVIDFGETTGNIFYAEEGATLHDCMITFRANNSIIYMSNSKYAYKRVKIKVGDGCALLVDKNNYFANNTSINMGENTNVFIGRNCLFAIDVKIKTCDPHLVYDIKTGERRNFSRSVFIGDHVWVGQSVFILKGSRVGSGSVLSAAAVVTGKTLDSNTAYGGNPAKPIAKDIFWDKKSVYKWTAEDTEKWAHEDRDIHLFDKTNIGVAIMEKIDAELKAATTAQEKMNILKNVTKNTSKSKFAINTSIEQLTEDKAKVEGYTNIGKLLK